MYVCWAEPSFCHVKILLADVPASVSCALVVFVPQCRVLAAVWTSVSNFCLIRRELDSKDIVLKTVPRGRWIFLRAHKEDEHVLLVHIAYTLVSLVSIRSLLLANLRTTLLLALWNCDSGRGSCRQCDSSSVWILHVTFLHSVHLLRLASGSALGNPALPAGRTPSKRIPNVSRRPFCSALCLLQLAFTPALLHVLQYRTAARADEDAGKTPVPLYISLCRSGNELLPTQEQHLVARALQLRHSEPLQELSAKLMVPDVLGRAPLTLEVAKTGREIGV